MQVYDIANLHEPKLVHQRNLVQPKGLALDGDFLIICDDDLKIFDISNPKEPSIVKSLPYQYKDVLIRDNTLFAFGDNKISQFVWDPSVTLELEHLSSVDY